MLRPLITSIALALLLSAYATDRVVSPSGTYNTISSAIAASSDGDRVLVASGNYTENVGIARSVSVLPLVEGTRYTVNGALTVTHGSAAMQVTISGMRANSAASTGGTGRLDLAIADSWLGTAVFPDPTTRVILLRDSLSNGAAFASGMIAGCVLGGISPGTVDPLVQLVTGSTLPDENLVVGNNIEFHPSVGNLPAYLIDLQGTQPFHLENNFVLMQSNNTRFCRVAGTPSSTQLPSSIANNTFYRISPMSAFTLTVSANISLSFVNNSVTNDTGGMVGTNGPSGPLSISHNLYAAPSWFNTSTGQPTGGSPLINAGDPDPRYLDLDLTTNDVGCYGGSNSRANFTTGMGGAVVGFMQAPRVVAQGEAVNINATGFDR